MSEECKGQRGWGIMRKGRSTSRLGRLTGPSGKREFCFRCVESEALDGSRGVRGEGGHLGVAHQGAVQASVRCWLLPACGRELKLREGETTSH